jgi:hypothetical protein
VGEGSGAERSGFPLNRGPDARTRLIHKIPYFSVAFRKSGLYTESVTILANFHFGEIDDAYGIAISLETKPLTSAESRWGGFFSIEGVRWDPEEKAWRVPFGSIRGDVELEERILKD